MPVGSSGFAGRAIHDHGFAADDGSASKPLVAALTAYAANRTDALEVMRALALGRLLVPVVAVEDRTTADDSGRTADQPAAEKRTAMATVLLENAHGGRSMLAFSCLDALRAWQGDARPVPVDAISAARAALQEGAGALLIDAAGPIAFAVSGDELSALAHSRVIPPGPDDAARLHHGLAACLMGEPAVLDARVNRQGARLELALVLDPSLPDEGYQEVRTRVVGRMSQLAGLDQAFPSGMHLRVVGPDADLGDTPSLLPPSRTQVGDHSSHDQEPDPEAGR